MIGKCNTGGGKPEEEKTVTAGTSAIVVNPSSGKVMKKVTVNPTPTESKSVTPTTSELTVTPSEGKHLSQVVVGAVEDVTPEVTAQTPVITQIAENFGVTITTPSGTNKQILQGNNTNLLNIKNNAKKEGLYAWKKCRNPYFKELPVGKEVMVDVNGSQKSFKIVHQGNPSTEYYGDDFNEVTWLHENGYGTVLNGTAYASSSSTPFIDSTLKSHYDTLNGKISIAKAVNVPYTDNTGDVLSHTTMEAFPISVQELGLVTSSSFATDGAELNYYAIGGELMNNGYECWLRTRYIGYSKGPTFYGTHGVDHGEYSTSKYCQVSFVTDWNTEYIYAEPSDKMLVEYVVSDDPNAYPNGGEQDGYWYEKVNERATAIDYGEVILTSNVESVTVTHNLGRTPLEVYLFPNDGSIYYKPSGYTASYLCANFNGNISDLDDFTTRVVDNVVTANDITFSGFKTVQYTYRYNQGTYRWIALA